jgi:putative ABC transport system permease protein
VSTYFKTKAGTSVATVEEKLLHFFELHAAADFEERTKMSIKVFYERGGIIKLLCQPITDIHLKSHFPNEIEPPGDIQYVYFFVTIGFLTIVLACVNFTNLSTARAATRAKEIGIRKTIGAPRSKLISQFLLESFLYSALSVALAIGLVSAGMNAFNLLSGKGLTISSLLRPYFLGGLAILTLVVSILAGGHPALFLTAFKPSIVLKGTGAAFRGLNFRRSLVVFQFCISLGLVICTLIINKQLHFIQSASTGFDKENIVVINNAMALGDKSEAFKNELLKKSEVLSASYAGDLPPYIKNNYHVGIVRSSSDSYMSSICEVDCGFLSTMGMKMASGRFFSCDSPADSKAVVINERAAHKMGLSFQHDKMKLWEDTFRIIGVVKDFNLEGLQSEIRPLIFYPRNNVPNRKLAIRLSKREVRSALESIQSTWTKFVPGSPLQYSFIDRDFEAQYRAEEKLGLVFSLLTMLAIIIACLGIFGLSTFLAEQRTKEIGIRKVMGSSLAQIVWLLSKDFLILTVVAFAISIPISWYGMMKWLENFAYRVDFDFVLYAIAGFSGVAITLLTSGYQSFKAASRNPIESLRSE